MVWSKSTITPVTGVPAPPCMEFTGHVATTLENPAFYAQLDGVVDDQSDLDPRHVRLNVVTGKASAAVFVGLEDGVPVPQLLGAHVKLAGVLSVKRDINSTGQIFEFWCPTARAIEVTGFLATDPRFDAPATAIENLPNESTTLYHVIGTVRSQEHGRSLILRDPTGQVTVVTRQVAPFQDGEAVEAIGLVHRHGVITELHDALVRHNRAGSAPPHLSYLLRLSDQVRAVVPGESARGVEAKIDAVVTWSSPDQRYFFVKDAAGGLKVILSADGKIAAPIFGAGLTIRGSVVQDQFVPALAATSVLPGDNVGVNEATPISYEHAMTGAAFAEWVQMQGYVRSFQRSETDTRVEVVAPGGEFVAIVARGYVPEMAGAIVRLRGVCDAIANDRRQLTAFRLLVPAPEFISVLEPASADPFATTTDSIGNLRRYNPTNPLNHRVQVQGTVLLHVPGRVLYVEDGADALTVLTRQSEKFAPGDNVAIVGLPGHNGSDLIMREALVRRRGAGAVPIPKEIHELSVADPSLDGHLVQLTGGLLSYDPIPDGVQLQLQRGNVIYSARLEGAKVAPIAVGSTLRLTGVYRLELTEARLARGFTLHLRSADDIVVVSRPPWWTADRVRWIAAAVVGFAVLGALWVAMLARKNRQLKAAQTDLRRANEELEVRVQARTAALTQEIEHRRASESALARERMLLRTLIDNLPVYLYVKDAAGRFVIDNLPHAQLLGAPSCEAVVGKTEADFWPAALADECQRTDRVVMSGGDRLVNREESFELSDGRRWHSTTKVPLRDADSQVTGLIAIVQDITDRKAFDVDRENLHRQLLDTSRRAGMAEVASGVLHNIGNVLNSVNISAGVASSIIGRSKSDRVGKVAELLEEHRDDLASFFAKDRRAHRIPDFLTALDTQLKSEQEELRKEIQSLQKNIEHIKQIVAMQQTYAKISGVTENVPVTDIIEDALRINAEGLARHGVEVRREFRAAPTLVIERHKVLQILVNLISNAKYACDENAAGQRHVTISVDENADDVEIRVQDNGIGIRAANLTRIFSHGFTTRKNGHGFGLHSGALTARELGGSLEAASEGPTRGATFTLRIPRTPAVVV